MKLLFTADWHLCLRNLANCKIVVNQLGELLAKHSPCALVHAGDIVGDRGPANPIDQRVTNFLLEELPPLVHASDGAFFARGNHDMISGPDGVPSICALMRVLGFNVADETWQGFDVGGTGVLLWLVPFFRDEALQRTQFREAWQDAKSYAGMKHPRVLTFHNAIEGVELNASAKGRGMSVADIGARAYDVCVGGHIHKPQKLEPNIWFVGDPYPNDWGECNTQKRHLMLEF